jgi:hypothetical protein
MEIMLLVIIMLLAANLVVVIGVMTTRRGSPAEPSPRPGSHLPPTEVATPPAAEVERLTKAAFEKAINQSTASLQQGLATTSAQLNNLIMRLTTDMVERELENYRRELAAARDRALTSIIAMQTAVEQRQKSLEADVDTEMAKYQAGLIAKFDHKLGAAVAAYITESLGQGADLGAQRAFLLDSLERNKEVIKADILDEA